MHNMDLMLENERPIYIQLADWLADNILSGVMQEEQQIPSTTEISVTYKINPATALKGINMLVDEGILYKKRGLGMFVSEGAVDKIREKRQKDFFDSYVQAMLSEAEKLGLSKKDIIQMIEGSNEQ